VKPEDDGFWVTASSSLGVDWRFRCTPLRNVGLFQQDYTALYPRRLIFILADARTCNVTCKAWLWRGKLRPHTRQKEDSSLTVCWHWSTCFWRKATNESINVRIFGSNGYHHHHQTFKELGHSLTRSGLVVQESLHWSSSVSSSTRFVIF
jgi:hypothetical protein